MPKPKTNAFTDAYEKKAPAQQETPIGSAASEPKLDGGGEKKAPSRRKRSQIAAYFPPEVHRQLRILGAEEDKTIQALLGEALDLLFHEYRKPTIAKPEGKAT